MFLRAVAAVMVMATAATAAAQSISGTVSEDPEGQPLPNMEVTAWALGHKGWDIVATTYTDGAGNYTLAVPAGDYKVHARRGPASAAQRTDRWYDVLPPLSGGYIGEDADEVAVAPGVDTPNIDIGLQLSGGIDGRVVAGGAPLAGAVVRIERAGELRIHHNDLSETGGGVGRFAMRGLIPAADYQFLLYDPLGVRETALVPGPYTVSPGAVGAAGDLAMTPYAADPYEPNNAASCGALTDVSPLRADPPQPWEATGAWVGPMGGDIDWYCFAAVEGDRLYVSTSTERALGGVDRFHPFTDPVVGLWSGARTALIAEDDDSGPGTRDAWLDSGPLQAGCHCLAVTMFGDTAYNGTGHNSTGRYALRLEMGNRPPLVKIKKGVTPITAIAIGEGEPLLLELEYPDPDGDPLTPVFAHTDSGAAPVAGSTFTGGATTGTFEWTPDFAAAAGSPYTVTVRAADAEFDIVAAAVITVIDINQPPDAPALIAPIDGAVEASPTPTLVVGPVTDPDGDAVSYEYELHYGAPTAAVAQSAVVADTSWVAGAIPENTRVFWRARATDTFDGGLSAWSPFEEFLVDSANEAPETPVLLKPTNGELLMVRRPGLSALNVADPEQEAIAFVFEVARDYDFTDVVWTGAPVPMDTLASTTMSVVDEDLAWGGSYFARVKARDARGLDSAWSNVNAFSTKPNIPPTDPALDGGCPSGVYVDTVPTSFTVTNVSDPEGETVTFELEVYGFDDDPAAATPLVTAQVEMDDSAAITDIPVDLSALESGHYKFRVRAFDGTDYTAWVECDFTLELTAGGAGSGCGCRATPRSGAPLVLVLLAWLALRAGARRAPWRRAARG